MADDGLGHQAATAATVASNRRWAPKVIGKRFVGASLCVLQYKRLGHRKETVVPPRIEVGRVAGAATLEIDAPESGAAGIDATTAGSIEHGYAVRAAHAEHGIDHTLAVATGKAIAHPRREENYLGTWIFLDEHCARQ